MAQSSSERTTKQARLEHPSGLLHLFRHESVSLMVDALLDLPPGREFNKSEFAEHAGVTRQTVAKHVDTLLELDIVERVEGTTPPRYRLADSAVVRDLFALNSELNEAAN